MKPYAESAEQNKQPILDVLKNQFNDINSVLEIGSGTGQHAVYFAEHLPHLNWYPSELEENIAGITQWANEATLPNLQAPITVDVANYDLPDVAIQAIFTANTMHIMSLPEVERFFELAATLLNKNQVICIYGPFSYHGQHVSDSNEQFDRWLKQIKPTQGVRDIDELQQFAHAQGFQLVDDITMPVNNQILVWNKLS